jgi:hypothetical protein
MILTPRDLDLLGVLNEQVRMLTLVQIAAGWWSSTDTGRKNAAKRLGMLVAAGFLQRADILARPLLNLECPMLAWNLGDPRPHFGALSWQLQSRWSRGPRRTRVYCASPRSVALLGGAALGQLKNLCQVTHDLHVGQVFLVYRRSAPHEVQAWCGEDALAPGRRLEFLPDAMLLDQFGNPYRVVEFGGSYPPQRLRAIHDDCLAHRLAYEIW